MLLRPFRTRIAMSGKLTFVDFTEGTATKSFHDFIAFVENLLAFCEHYFYYINLRAVLIKERTRLLDRSLLKIIVYLTSRVTCSLHTIKRWHQHKKV